MESKLKKSLIKNWWVAPTKAKMEFVNILNKQSISNQDDLVVMGYLHNKKDVLASSTNKVVKVIKEGVITGQGTLYPFTEAHNLYLHFLLLVNNPNVVIANRWEILNNNQMIANLVYNIGVEVVQKDVVFSFKPNMETSVLLSGYSESLKSKVVLSPFNVRHQCLLLGVRDDVLNNIWKGSFATKDETTQKVKSIQRTF